MMRFAFFLILISYQLFASGQCCSGGVPMAGNLGMPTADQGTWQFNLSYDVNILNTLKQESEFFDEDNRTRLTQSYLLETGYTITSKLSVDALLPFIQQDREIVSNNETDFTTTRGIGDIIFLVKYQVLPWLNLGYASKVPSGSSDKKQNGIALNADMQPGSGAWDHIVWSGFNQPSKVRPSMSVFGNGIYRIRGTNDSYLGNSSYRFGNEIQIIAGISDQLLIGNAVIEPSVRGRFRAAKRDDFNGFGISSSGGTFLFINPGVSWRIKPQTAIQVNYEFPVYSRVNEIQLSPTHRINLGVFVAFGSNNLSF